MKKPNNYDEIAENISEKNTGYERQEPLEVGGHYLTIKHTESTTSKSGKPMLKIEYDTHAIDSQPEWFSIQHENSKRFNPNPYYRGTHYIMLTEEDWAVRNLASFITAVEKSNEDFKFDWNPESLIGKNVGGVFGEVESEWNGKVYTNVELRWFCSDDSVPDAKIPTKKTLSGEEETDPVVDPTELPFDL